MAEHDELIAAGRSIEEIREQLGADSLAYLSLEGLQLAIERPARALLPRLPDRQLPDADARGGGAASSASSASPRGHERPRAADLRRRPASRCEAAEAIVGRLRRAVASTRTPRVLGDLGGFAGLVRQAATRDPVLVAGTDGVGTKLLLQREAARCATRASTSSRCASTTCSRAARSRRCFLDYIAVGRLDPERVGRRGRGRRRRLPPGRLRAARRRDGRACRTCMAADDLDLAGFALGEVVERDEHRRRHARRERRRGRSGWPPSGAALERLHARAPRARARRPGPATRRRPARADAHLRARGGGPARGLRRARHGAHHGRRHPGQPAARAARRPRRAHRRGALAGARRRSAGWPARAWRATRCGACSTAASAIVAVVPPGDGGRGDRGLRGRGLRGLADRRGRARATASSTRRDV